MILEIKSKDSGWVYKFRKNQGRPIEFLKEHVELGPLGNWQPAKNLYLKALIDRDDLAKHFGCNNLSEI